MGTYEPGAHAESGALALAPADDILITVERPMELDTEAQMVASILDEKLGLTPPPRICILPYI